MISAAIDVVCDGPAAAVEIRSWGGAMARPSADAGPVSPRDMPFSVMIDGPFQPHIAARASGRSFLNWQHDTGRTHTAYPVDDYRRLRELKARFDPDNLFRRGHNIPPG